MDPNALEAPNPLAPEPAPEPDEQQQQAEQAAPDEGADDGDDADELEADDGDPKLSKAIKERAKWKSRARDAETKLTDATAQLEAATTERDALRDLVLERNRADVRAWLATRGIKADAADQAIEVAEKLRGFDMSADVMTLDIGNDDGPEPVKMTAELRAREIAKLTKLSIAVSTGGAAMAPGWDGKAVPGGVRIDPRPTSAI